MTFRYIAKFSDSFGGVDTCDDNVALAENTKFVQGRANRSVADALSQSVRVLCSVTTTPENYTIRAVHVRNTWGKRCNIFLLMSSTSDDRVDTVKLPVIEGRDQLWEKTRELFKYVYANHLFDAEWFLKADDDTYVIVENLRYMLFPYDPNKPLYFGCKLKVPNNPTITYMSGGAGYILSREALRRFVEVALKDDVNCLLGQSDNEDVQMGRCLNSVDVTFADTRDADDRLRFLPFSPQKHLISDFIPQDSWYWQRVVNPGKNGSDCCSNVAISFHYVRAHYMYILDYLIYELHPFGVSYVEEILTKNNSTKTF